MKRIILILFSTFLLMSEIYAQYNAPEFYPIDKYEVLDSAYIKCVYKLSSVKDTLKPNDVLFDRQVLLIGHNKSNYFSQYVMDYNKKTSDYIASKKRVEGIEGNKYKGSYGYNIYTDIKTNKMKVTYNGVYWGAFWFVYPDSITDLSWNLKNDTTTLLGYKCQKATTYFRGRAYTAWFTLEIPISEGPWKFKGLPGLILQISDSQNYFNFECQGVQHLKKLEPIKYYTKNSYKEITRKWLEKDLRNYHRNAHAYDRARGIKTMVQDKNGKWVETTTSIKTYPYNPIEK